MSLDWHKVKETLKLYETELLAIPEVTGVSSGILIQEDYKEACIKVYVIKSVDRGPLQEHAIPLSLDGVPVEVIVTGIIEAFNNGD